MLAETLEQYIRSPLGSGLVRPTFAHFSPVPGVCATFLFGKPSREDAVDLVRVLRLEMDGTFPPHVSFADSRGLAWVDPMAFATLAEHFDATRARAKVQITKQAMVHPPGLVGTITAGYFLTYVTGFPFRAFSVPGPALAWLQISEELFASWEAHIASARPLPELVVDLRQWLQRSLSDPDIDQAASTLRLSKRTLQRRLEAHHTSYQRELDHVRFYVARRELSDTDDKVGAIAAECGFKTQQHFQDWFRQIAGCTPGEYRAKTRGSP